MCGELMRLHAVEAIVRIPGTPQGVKGLEQESLCPDGDYFEGETHAPDLVRVALEVEQGRARPRVPHLHRTLAARGDGQGRVAREPQSH